MQVTVFIKLPQISPSAFQTLVLVRYADLPLNFVNAYCLCPLHVYVALIMKQLFIYSGC